MKGFRGRGGEKMEEMEGERRRWKGNFGLMWQKERFGGNEKGKVGEEREGRKGMEK